MRKIHILSKVYTLINPSVKFFISVCKYWHLPKYFLYHTIYISIIRTLDLKVKKITNGFKKSSTAGGHCFWSNINKIIARKIRCFRGLSVTCHLLSVLFMSCCFAFGSTSTCRVLISKEKIIHRINATLFSTSKISRSEVHQHFTAVFTVIVANSRLDFLAGSGKTFCTGIANPWKS